MSKTDKSAWLSGEVCDRAAIYFADSCGHPIRKEYRKLDIFIRCPTCHQSIRWTRSGKSSTESLGDSENFA